MSEEKKSIKENVLATIDSGKVAMKPKWYFMAKATLLVLGIILASLTVLYLASFIIFIMHQNGIWFAPRFGWRGMGELMFGLPWLLLAVATAFIVLLQILVKKYAFSYGKPLLYSAVVIIIMVLLGGFLLAKTSIHKGLMDRAHDNHLPFAGKMYKEYGRPVPNGKVTPGKIEQVTDFGYVVTTPLNEQLKVLLQDDEQEIYKNSFVIGDDVVIFGKRDGDQITAVAIHKVSKDMFMGRGKEKFGGREPR